MENFKRELLVTYGMFTENYVHYLKIYPLIQAYNIYTPIQIQKIIQCDVNYLLSIPELLLLKSIQFSNLNLQNRKGFFT